MEFDLTADDEAVWGWGIGCNGVTELLVEPESSALALAEAIKSMPPGDRSRPVRARTSGHTSR